MLSVIMLSMLVGLDSQLSPDLNWDNYYYHTSATFSEVNDLDVIGDNTLLSGGRWTDYTDQSDGEVVLMRHDRYGNLLWEAYPRIERGSIAYGSCVNGQGNLVITGSTRLGTANEALFLAVIDPSNGSVLAQYVTPLGADNPFDMGYDVFQHSNGNYYVAARLSLRMCLIRFDQHTLQPVDWWLEPAGAQSQQSWAYADCLGEIPAGYDESGMIVLGYGSRFYGGMRMVVMESDLTPVAESTFGCSCSDAGSYHPGTG